MSLGAILVGIAVAMVVLAYIAQPFRKTTVNSDDVIETWIKQHGQPASLTRASTPPLPESPPATPPPAPVEMPIYTPQPIRATRESSSDTQINFCPQCGRRVAPDHRYCPGCGYQLPREEAEA